jgi:hypothetical protein
MVPAHRGRRQTRRARSLVDVPLGQTKLRFRSNRPSAQNRISDLHSRVDWPSAPTIHIGSGRPRIEVTQFVAQFRREVGPPIVPHLLEPDDVRTLSVKYRPYADEPCSPRTEAPPQVPCHDSQWLGEFAHRRVSVQSGRVRTRSRQSMMPVVRRETKGPHSMPAPDHFVAHLAREDREHKIATTIGMAACRKSCHRAEPGSVLELSRRL